MAITPQEVLMNVLADAERIEHIVICVYTKDKVYESWSNELPSHVRLGLLRECSVRIETTLATATEELE